MKRKDPIAVTQAIQALTKLGDAYGLEAVHHVYAEAVGELMAGREREVWRAKVTEGQREMFALLESGVQG
ncbi:MAG: hypothetical protein ACREU9_00070 [Gammaproteobacteria bacterium]